MTKPDGKMDQARAEMMALMGRYVRLGQLLPDIDTLDTDDDMAVAEVRVILDEMNKVKAEIDAALNRRVH